MAILNRLISLKLSNRGIKKYQRCSLKDLNIRNSNDILTMSGSETIECIYEGGVLKPSKKVDLKEKVKVRVTIKPEVDLGDFVMAKLTEEKIRELEERFESEDIYFQMMH